jgi:hypothetical protein
VAPLRVVTPSGKFTLGVELKRSHLTRALAEHVIRTAADGRSSLLMAPSVGSELAERFVQRGVNFVDLAGNCFVQLDDRYIARIQGQRAAQRAPAEKALRAPAYRVLFALLAEPELARATLSRLAAAAGGVSPQTASELRARLIDGGVLIDARGGPAWGRGRRQQTVETFLFGFPILMAGATLGRFRARQRASEALDAELTPPLGALGEWRWGGGAGAQRLTGYYRGDRTLVYLRDDVELAVLKRLPLVPDPAGDVVVLRAPGPLAFSGPHPEVVHPLLVYADLLTEGHDRSREAAAEIYDRFLVERST